MTSNTESNFKAVPPIRTSTVDSTKSCSSDALSPGSDNLSPTATHTQGTLSPASPTEMSFFGAISSKLRSARSRSRSRSGKNRQRSRSPMAMPPEQLPPSATAQPTVPAPEEQRPRQSRHASSSSQSAVPQRPSIRPEGGQRRTSSDMWRGRHSNSWLFNDFSVTESAKKAFKKS